MLDNPNKVTVLGRLPNKFLDLESVDYVGRPDAVSPGGGSIGPENGLLTESNNLILTEDNNYLIWE
jgi:hypothetical protein|tara:strand:- start:1485 stop:1682 length:198 start_codon:yes stop_codon:yes gene_type:complete